MAFFGLSDITFNKQTTKTKGPLRALEGTEFSTNALRYPIDVGNYDKGHYMVIYIRQQKNSQFKKGAIASGIATGSSMSSGGGLPINITNVGSLTSKIGADLLGKLNSGLSQLNSATGGKLSGLTNSLSSAASGTIGNLNNLFGQASTLSGSGSETNSIIDNSIKSISDESFIKTTELTTDAIALYMPDTIQYQYQQSYDQATPGNELIGQLAAAGVSAAQNFKEKGSLDALTSVGKSATLLAGDKLKGLLGKETGDVAMAAVGIAKNPMLEMIYKSPNFRTFQYDFMFYPRDEKESLEVMKIIERLCFHQAPEIIKDSQGFLIPPSEFEIHFYYGGTKNPNIPSIGRCILTSISTNFAPNGWSSYEVPGENKPNIGRTGMPTAIQLTLQFQEVVYLTKKDFTQI